MCLFPCEACASDDIGHLQLGDILSENIGTSFEAVSIRASLLEDFIEHAPSADEVLTAELIYAADLIHLGVSNAGDARFDEGRRMLEEIYSQNPDGWHNSVARFGLIAAYHIRGNQNSDEENQRQVTLAVNAFENSTLQQLKSEESDGFKMYSALHPIDVGALEANVLVMLEAALLRQGMTSADADEYIQSLRLNALGNKQSNVPHDRFLDAKEESPHHSSKRQFWFIGTLIVIGSLIFIVRCRARRSRGT